MRPRCAQDRMGAQSPDERARADRIRSEPHAVRVQRGVEQRDVVDETDGQTRGDEATRELAAETLGETGCRQAWNALMRALHDPSDSVRVAAACALEVLGLPETMDAPQVESPTRQIEGMLADVEPKPRPARTVYRRTA